MCLVLLFLQQKWLFLCWHGFHHKNTLDLKRKPSILLLFSSSLKLQRCLQWRVFVFISLLATYRSTIFTALAGWKGFYFFLARNLTYLSSSKLFLSLRCCKTFRYLKHLYSSNILCFAVETQIHWEYHVWYQFILLIIFFN